jgi:hypothetical protein
VVARLLQPGAGRRRGAVLTRPNFDSPRTGYYFKRRAFACIHQHKGVAVAWKTYYNFENTGATWGKLVLDKATNQIVKSAGGEVKFNSDVEGSCFGYSYEWARRFMEFRDALKSKPTKVGGTPLQQLYEMKFKAAGGSKFQRNAVAIPSVVTTGGNRVASQFSMDDDKIAEKVNTDNLTVIFDIGLHWMGMGKLGSLLCFFDSNYGLISGDTVDEYKDIVTNFVNDYSGMAGYTKSWDVYSLAIS